MAEARPPAGASKVVAGWLTLSAGKVVAASFVGLAVSGSPILIYTQSVFLRPMTQAFGWSRGTYFLPLTIGGLIGAAATLIIGGLSDRQGVRPWLLGGVLAFGLLNIALAATPASIWIYDSIVIALVLAAAAHGPLLYTKAISEWAMARPGEAMAIALAGTAFGGIVTPPLCVWLIEHYGWRAGRASLGVLVLGIALPIIWAAIRPPPLGRRAHVLDLETRQTDNSLPLRAALGTCTYAQLLAGVFAASFGLNGPLANLTPLVTDHGLSPTVAAMALSAFAAAQILGRLLSGAILDRIEDSRVGAAFFALALLGLLTLGNSSGAAMAIAGAALLGLALGSELQLGAYFAMRFFGLKHYGSIYGLLMAVFTVGGTLGPFAFGLAFDYTHRNTLGLAMSAGAVAVAVLVFATLGQYRFATPGRSTAPQRDTIGE